MRILASDVRMLEVTKADATQMERCQAKLVNDTPTMAEFLVLQKKTEENFAQIAADALRFSAKVNKANNELVEADSVLTKRIEEISNC